MAEPAQISPSSPPFGEEMARFGRWCREHPAEAALLAALLGTLTYFFAFHGIFNNGLKTTLRWAYEGWNEENDLQHGSLILPAALVVAWMHRAAFRAAAKAPSWLGLLAVLAGAFAFVVSAWTLQPRIALVSLPLLVFGAVWFLWGWQTARVAAFPCLFLLFMVPLGFILGHTEPLQRFVASIVTGLSNLVGVGLEREGVKLISTDHRATGEALFRCEVAGGCSGIRSLMAMAMLSALYGHFTLRDGWKKVLLFAMSLPFAVLGNIARVLTIVLASKFFGEAIGTGPWHDISGFIVTIPIAVSAMLAFSNLLQRDWSGTKAALLAPDVPRGSGSDRGSSSGPISYDY